MMPPYSWAVPGRNPGTSTNVTSGTLKQSQNRTKRAAFTEALMSRQPARWAGWLATIPTGRPPRRPNPTTILGAKSAWTSKKYWSSSTVRTIVFMSYGLFGCSGTTVCSDSSRRSTGSSVGCSGGSSRLFWEMKVSSSRISARHSSSLSAEKCATPEVPPWVEAPPSSSAVTASWVTALITSGPVTNMYEVFLTMKTKSVMDGEYTAPPAHGPRTAEIWGTTPDASVFRKKMSAYPARETTPSWMRAPPESLSPTTGVPLFIARSMILQIFFAYASDSEPPKTVKSWA